MSGKDPFILSTKCIDRLLEVYKEHGKLLIAVDFDDTVYDYHGLQYTYPWVFNALRRAKSQEHIITVFTCCAEKKYMDIRTYFSEHGVYVDYINENPPGLPFGNNTKVYYNILLDDKAGLGQALYILEETLNQISQIRNLS